MKRRWSLAAALAVALVATSILVATSCDRFTDQDDATTTTTATGALEVILSWDPTTDAAVVSFNVYGVATDGDPATVPVEAWQLLDEVPVAEAAFDAKALRIVMTPEKQLKLAELAGKNACFRITALTAAAESPASQVVCGKL